MHMSDIILYGNNTFELPDEPNFCHLIELYHGASQAMSITGALGMTKPTSNLLNIDIKTLLMLNQWAKATHGLQHEK